MTTTRTDEKRTEQKKKRKKKRKINTIPATFANARASEMIKYITHLAETVRQMEREEPTRERERQSRIKSPNFI